ncbi:MAG: hypothetical protein J0G96_14865 [Flavobacteriia bacterium]|nr:hypothetical protein [Flavobacteriia bacterium]OJX37492.1 MAG: hypothetical protein BGO87_00585 [Flavobacteriia bacterium 40-80]
MKSQKVEINGIVVNLSELLFYLQLQQKQEAIDFLVQKTSITSRKAGQIVEAFEDVLSEQHSTYTQWNSVNQWMHSLLFILLSWLVYWMVR